MSSRLSALFLFIAAAAIASCGRGAGGPANPPVGDTLTLPQSATVLATATPLVIHVGFELAEHTDPIFGPVYFYSPILNKQAQVIHVRSGSKVVFLNDDPSGAPHTASGFGSGGFPKSFDNTSGFKRNGTTINSSLTWSSGTLNHGQKSQVFTIGPRGNYYFGCNFHYTTKPTTTNRSMGDVVVSM